MSEVDSMHPLDRIVNPTWQAIDAYDEARKEFIFGLYVNRARLPEDSEYEAELMGKAENLSARFRDLAINELVESEDTQAGLRDLSILWDQDDHERRVIIAALRPDGAPVASARSTLVKLISEAYRDADRESEAIDQLEQFYLLRVYDDLDQYVEFIEDRKQYRDIKRELRRRAGRAIIGASVLAVGMKVASRYLRH